MVVDILVAERDRDNSLAEQARQHTLSASDPAPESINSLSQKDDPRFLRPMHYLGEISGLILLENWQGCEGLKTCPLYASWLL
jgi:hypothetical protein